MDRTSLDWAHLFKNGLSAVIKLPGVTMPFLILSLSCPECGCDFRCSFICIQAVVLIFNNYLLLIFIFLSFPVIILIYCYFVCFFHFFLCCCYLFL